MNSSSKNLIRTQFDSVLEKLKDTTVLLTSSPKNNFTLSVYLCTLARQACHPLLLTVQSFRCNVHRRSMARAAFFLSSILFYHKWQLYYFCPAAGPNRSTSFLSAQSRLVDICDNFCVRTVSNIAILFFILFLFLSLASHNHYLSFNKIIYLTN